jgi:hypothetical protein
MGSSVNGAVRKWLARAALGLASVVFASAANAEPVRILVAAGSQRGLAAERPLKFAHTDATRVREVMVGQGGVRTEHATVLMEPSRAQLFAALELAKAEAQKHTAGEVTLVFYFSGHGDREALHLGDERVLLTDIQSKLNEVPAGLRIVVTDACRATRDKGFSAEAPFAISVTTIPQATGSVWLHASSDGEAAQESDELQGAIFTHSWLNGLRGAADANGDSRVTLEESFAFAHSQTLIRSAKSSGVLQKPEAVVSLREASPVVLTQAYAKLGTLSLPSAKDTHFLVYQAGSKSVIAELWGSGDRRTALSLAPGRYIVQRRVAGNGGAAQIAIGEGEARSVEERDFAPASLEALARKGGELGEVTKHEVAVGYDLGQNARSGFLHGPRAAYSYAPWPSLAFTGGASLELSDVSAVQRDERMRAGFVRFGVEPRLRLGVFTVRAGLGGRAGVLWQTLAKKDLFAPLVPTAAQETTNAAFGFGPEVYAALRLGTRSGTNESLEAGYFVDIGGTGSALFFREESAMKTMLGGAVMSSLGAQF